jgi:anti-sigma factor RsiW
MTDPELELTEREMADLCAFADGSLPAERRPEVEARVAASPALLALVERQRCAVAATRALPDEPVPQSLTDAVAAAGRAHSPAAARSRRRSWRLGFGLAAAATLAAVAAVVLVLAVGPGSSGPSVADVARLAALPPNGPAPARAGTAGAELAADVQGVTFPDLSAAYGWRAAGVRNSTVGGRDATVVYYDRAGDRIAYAIVAGPGLSPPAGGRTVTVDGVPYQTLTLGGRSAVTWRRGGHTCVLTGSAPAHELLTLAAWSTASGGSLTL